MSQHSIRRIALFAGAPALVAAVLAVSGFADAAPDQSVAASAAPSGSPSAAPSGSPSAAAPGGPAASAAAPAVAPATAPAPAPAPATAAPSASADSAAPSTAPSATTPPPPLAPAKLPDNAAASWKPMAPPHTQPVTHDIGLNECASVHGALTWQQQGYVSAFKTPAIQDSFSFADPATAQRTYQSLLATMDSCQDASRALQTKAHVSADAQVSRTATTTDGTAYARQWTAVGGMSAAGPQTSHIYLVQRGNLLTVLQFPEPAESGATYATKDDQSALTALADQMNSASATK
ncbi:hypothetical protein [Kitasatospora sp. NPDC056531]|uniref:hypothetical protein n=1 Tax=Kitasatospora sp. NPDC056531 TaxID=3345856 RepID=UPI0036C7EECF